MLAISPMTAGAIPEISIYEVMVRFIFSTETWRDAERALIAGKKIKDERGENVAAKETRNTIKRFRVLVKLE
jgi:hypothetical protein